jgi:hypothetical protein
MPKDRKGAPVEEFRLTEGQRAFQGKFGKLRKLQELLQLRSLVAMREMNDVQQMWQQLEGEFQMLEPPKEPVRELQGMNFGEAEGSPSPQDQEDFVRQLPVMGNSLGE